MNIKQLKKELGLSQKDIADFYDMSYNAYANSSAKKRYETALCRFYECVLLGGKKNETKNLTDTDHRINNETQPLILYGVVNSNCDKKPKKCKHKYGLFTHINNGRNLMFKCKKCKKDMTYKQLQIERKERK